MCRGGAVVALAMSGSDVLLVFVKQPQPGQVKTRLAGVLGDELAARLYRGLAEDQFARTAGGAYTRLFCFSPAQATAEIERWLPGELLLPQQGANLGDRMAHAFAAAFARGARRVAIVGTDTPAVSRRVVEEALAGLDSADLVLGPAHDGGYYLLALAQPQPALFQGIAWSTPAVLADTVFRASLLGLGVQMLDAQRDIDTIDDLRALWPSLRGRLPAATVACIEPLLA